MTVLLTWYGNRGCAQRLGRTIALRAAPDLGCGDGPAHELVYDPGSNVRTVRPRAIDERRDLRIDEEASALELLRAFVPSEPAPL